MYSKEALEGMFRSRDKFIAQMCVEGKHTQAAFQNAARYMSERTMLSVVAVGDKRVRDMLMATMDDGMYVKLRSALVTALGPSPSDN